MLAWVDDPASAAQGATSQAGDCDGVPCLAGEAYGGSDSAPARASRNHSLLLRQLERLQLLDEEFVADSYRCRDGLRGLADGKPVLHIDSDAAASAL